MLVMKRTLVVQCLYLMYESRHRFSNILESRDARLPNRFDENRHQRALKPPKPVLLQIALKPRIIRETRPKWTFSLPDFPLQTSRKTPMSTSNQEPNVTVRDTARSKTVKKKKKTAGRVGKMGNFH